MGLRWIFRLPGLAKYAPSRPLQGGDGQSGHSDALAVYLNSIGRIQNQIERGIWNLKMLTIRQANPD